MTLGQLDDVLKRWRARLSAVAENLLALQADTTFQALTGTGGLSTVKVTGASAAQVEPALRAMNGLFAQFGSLQATIDEAEALRRGLPAVFGGEAKLRQLEQLLCGRSIEVEAPEVPLAERTLISGVRATVRITPEELLNTMSARFAEVQSAVATVGRAWTDFADAQDRVEQEIARLHAQTALPTALLETSLHDVTARLHALREQMHTDPLCALAGMRAELEPAVARVRQRVTAAEQVAAQLRTARATWESLERVHGEAAALATEAREKIADDAPGPQLVPESKRQSLGAWLGRLDSKREQGAVEAVGVGVRNWMAAAEACLAQDRSALRHSTERLAARGELRGRFDALKAKARAYGLAERKDVQALAVTAQAALYARPVSLQAASAAVARYEEHLRAGQANGALQRSDDPQRSVAAR